MESCPQANLIKVLEIHFKRFPPLSREFWSSFQSNKSFHKLNQGKIPFLGMQKVLAQREAMWAHKLTLSKAKTVQNPGPQGSSCSEPVAELFPSPAGCEMW